MADTATPTLTRDERKAELELIKTKKELAVEGEKVNLTLDPETQKMVEMVDLILDATYGPVGGTDAAGATSAPATGEDPMTAGQKGTPSVKKPNPEEEAAKAAADVDPISTQCKEIDAQLGALYDQLVEEIKAAAQPDVKVESAEQLKAGAVQFLRQCNATLEMARQTLDAAKTVAEQNNAKFQSIQRAAEDLEKRSNDYRTMTTGGVKNGQ